MFVYLLKCTDGSTYVGATVNLDRRLRQHNKELKGGARRTGMKVANGKTWHRVCYVSGFPDWTATLQFEWRWKQLTRKYSGDPLDRRMMALCELLKLSQSTTKALPFSEWDRPPILHVENDEPTCSLYFQSEGTNGTEHVSENLVIDKF